MIDRRQLLAVSAAGAVGMALWSRAGAAADPVYPVHYTDAQWKARLGPAAYEVLRHEDTEQPFSSPLLKEHRAGVFSCKGCALPAFTSRTKFDSGTGWPSFWAPLPNAVITKSDTSLLTERTEVHCRRCGGHLGHVFDDGPKPTGKRYCMNGVALTFKPGAVA